MEQVTENVYVETAFPGCNSSFLVTSEGVVVIDAPMIPADARAWNKEAEKHGPVRYVINTEPHIDHISGNCYFGGTVVGHEGTRGAILESSKEELAGALKRMSPGSPPLGDDFRFRPSEITFSKKLSLYLGKHTIQLINLPGHSPYQSPVFVPEEKIIFTSDNVTGTIPYMFQAIPDEWLKSLEQMQLLDVEVVVPGHGGAGSRSLLSKMHAVIRSWIDAVKSAKSAGLTLEEAGKKISLKELHPDIETNEGSEQVKLSNVARLYEVLK
jgi:cyclase